MDEDLLADLAERLIGTKTRLRSALVELVSEAEGVPAREVVERYPVNNVRRQLLDDADLGQCAECGTWTDSGGLMEAGNELMCLICHPELEYRAAAHRHAEPEESDDEPVEDDESRHYFPDDDDEVDHDLSLRPLEDP